MVYSITMQKGTVGEQYCQGVRNDAISIYSTVQYIRFQPLEGACTMHRCMGTQGGRYVKKGFECVYVVTP